MTPNNCIANTILMGLEFECSSFLCRIVLLIQYCAYEATARTDSFSVYDLSNKQRRIQFYLFNRKGCNCLQTDVQYLLCVYQVSAILAEKYLYCFIVDN